MIVRVRVLVAENERRTFTLGCSCGQIQPRPDKDRKTIAVWGHLQEITMYGYGVHQIDCRSRTQR